MAQTFQLEGRYTGLAWRASQYVPRMVMHHCLSPHQIVKGQWFTTVKVRNDPEPRFPETGLETGVEDVEVGLSDDVAVSTRAAILRLREQTFILVERMDENVQAVLFQPFS